MGLDEIKELNTWDKFLDNVGDRHGITVGLPVDTVIFRCKVANDVRVIQFSCYVHLFL